MTDPTPRTAATAREVDAVTFEGILGWSNKRTGVEFYHSWEDGRWGQRTGVYAEGEPPKGGWGHLLADDIESALGHAEGRPVVVIVGKRGQSSDDLIALAAAEAPGRVVALEALADQWEREAEGSGWMEQQPWRIRRQHASALRAALAVPAPTPSEPVARCGFTYPSGLVCDHERVPHVHDKVWAFQHPFIPGARDE